MTSPSHGRHVPLRRCVACRKSLPKSELLRFALDSLGAWQRDVSARAHGRGAWLCYACAAEPDSKRLSRFFRGQAPRIVSQLARREGIGTGEQQVGGLHG